jgi:hypothetical protein
VNPLPAQELALLRSLLDRLIPADEFDGAVEAGVDAYVARQLGGDLSALRPAVSAGLMGLDAEARARRGLGFLEVTDDERTAMVADLEAGNTLAAWEHPARDFISLMISLAAEGYYADPGNGGNRDGVSWRMLGYDPGVGDP